MKKEIKKLKKDNNLFLYYIVEVEKGRSLIVGFEAALGVLKTPFSSKGYCYLFQYIVPELKIFNRIKKFLSGLSCNVLLFGCANLL